MDRINAILSNVRAEEVVALMNVEDLYFLVQEVGAEDALAVLELATTEQIGGIFDLEVWTKDRLRVPRMRKWFALLLDMDDERYLAHMRGLDRAMVLAYLRRFVRVHKQDETFDPIESDKVLFVTPDQRYYLEMLRPVEECQNALGLLERAAKLDFGLLYELLEGAYWDLDANLEEQAYEEKVRRLADLGFPDYYSALEILEVRDPRKIRFAPRVWRSRPAFDVPETPPAYPVLAAASDSLLDRALARLSDDAAHDVRWEIAYVANRYLVARQVDVGDLAAVKKAVGRVHDLLNIGIEGVCGGSEDTAADTLTRYSVRDPFVLGNSLVQLLARHAKRLTDRLAATWGVPGSHLLDAPYREFLDELQDAEPRFFLGVMQKGLVGSRGFATIADIRAARHLLRRLDLLAGVFARLVPADRFDADLSATNLPDRAELRFAPLFVAGVAHRALGGDFALAPLPLTKLGDFVRAAVATTANGWAFSSHHAEEFAASLAALGELDAEAVAQVRPFFEEMLDAAADELGRISPDAPPDPRFLKQIWIARGA
jgi:hypothetical protein